MRFNKIRILLIICCVTFVAIGSGVFIWLTPSLNKTAEIIVFNDTKARLLLNTDYIIEAIKNNSLEHNYGLTTYTIPKGKYGLRTDMYSFYILRADGKVIYSTNDNYKKEKDLLYEDYITKAFIQRDSSGTTIGVLGNQVYYITTRTTINSTRYLLVYEIDVKEVHKGVFAFQFLFIIGFTITCIIVIYLSAYIDKQYNIILGKQIEIQKYTEYLLIIFNTVQDVILIIDYVGNIINSNKAITNIFGYTIEELIGKNIETIVKSDCLIITENHYMCVGIKNDGTLIKCEIHQNPLMLSEESKLQLLVIEDVTEREHLREQLYASITVTTETMKAIAGNG